MVVVMRYVKKIINFDFENIAKEEEIEKKEKNVRKKRKKRKKKFVWGKRIRDGEEREEVT
jgi:hypothetical protein